MRTTSTTCPESENGKISIELNYEFEKEIQVLLNDDNIGALEYGNILDINNLSKGDYKVCFQISNEIVRCYDVKIKSPDTLFVKTDLNRETKTLGLTISGGQSIESYYRIKINDQTIITRDNNIQINLNQEINVIKISTDKDCIGTYTETIVLKDNVYIVPNPFKDKIRVYKPSDMNVLAFRIIDLIGNSYKNLKLSVDDDVIEIDAQNLIHGMYMLELNTNYGTIRKKILKK